MANDTDQRIPGEINICFYGLNRSLSKTHISITDHLINPLNEQGIRVNLYACLIKTTGLVSNSRTGELDAAPESNEQTLLPQASIRYLEQETIDALIDWDLVFSLGDVFGDAKLNNGISPSGSICNAIRALSSLRAVQEMVPKEKRDHPAVFIRPDVDILAPLPWPAIFAALNSGPTRYAYGPEQGSAIVPSWHRWDGVNDRFAICSPGEATIAYANRISFLSDYLRISARAFHPESFLLHVMTMRHIQTLPIIDTPMVRIRCEGKVQEEPFSEGSRQRLYPTAAWQSLVQLNQELAARLRESEKVHREMAEIGATTAELKRTQAELQDSQKAVENLRSELELSIADLQHSRNELNHTTSELQDTKKQLRLRMAMETELESAWSALRDAQDLYHEQEREIALQKERNNINESMRQELKNASTTTEHLSRLTDALTCAQQHVDREQELRHRLEKDLKLALATLEEREQQLKELQQQLVVWQDRAKQQHNAEHKSEKEHADNRVGGDLRHSSKPIGAELERLALLEKELSETRRENNLLHEELQCAQERLQDLHEKASAQISEPEQVDSCDQTSETPETPDKTRASEIALINNHRSILLAVR